MKTNELQENGYLLTIRKGIDAARRFRAGFTRGQGSRQENEEKLKDALERTDALVIGAGAGLSTSAGFTYSGERFHKYFFDFEEKFGITDMYSGGFYRFPDEETLWAWWARHVYFNRYVKSPKPVYEDLLALVKNKNYFVITTNVDHRFQTAGFDKQRLFYTQGDYGLFQKVGGKDGKTYDNEEWVMNAMSAQGFIRNDEGFFELPENGRISMRIPSALIPASPDGGKVTMNLRSDDTFVEDEGWRAASRRYAQFLSAHEGGRVLFLELGVGSNTPVIIKYPFWAMTAENERALYACLNYKEAFCPVEIAQRSIMLDGDTGETLKRLF